MPCFAARPERGWTKPACPSGIATARPVPTSARAAGRQLDSLARGEVEPRVAGVRARRQHGVGAEPPDRRVGSGELPARPVRRAESATTNGREPRQVAPRQAGDHAGRRPRRVGALLDRRPERVELARGAPPSRVRARAGARASSGRRNARRARPSARRGPRRCAAETCGASGKRFARRRRPSGSIRSILFRTTSIGSSPAPISLRTSSTASRCRSCSSSEAAASITCSTMSATSVSSRVEREPLDELMRQTADEADGVGDEVAPAVGLEAARRRVERLEEPVFDRDVGAGQGVQERRLADVRVARQRDRGRLGALPLLAPRRALALDRLQLAAQAR